MQISEATPILAALSLGLALASAPGPVQAVLLSESVRGGIGRGFRALAGASATFGTLLVLLALGLSLAPPGDVAVRVLKVVGGAFLLWLAVDAIRSGHRLKTDETRRSLPPPVRGALSIVLNPGAWLFLAAVASPLFADATRLGGRPAALLAALALLVGVGAGDVVVVLLGGLGLRRAREGARIWIQRALALVLGGLGVWLIVDGAVG